jgi:hypothetical protein
MRHAVEEWLPMLSTRKGTTLKVQSIDLDAVAQWRRKTRSFAYLTEHRSTPTSGSDGMSRVW